MLMVIPNEGKILWLTWALTGNPPTLENFTLKLYQNNFTPVDATTAADFTESTFTGYAAQTLLRTSFPTPAIVLNVAFSALTSAPTFVCTGGAAQNCYGWYMLGATSGKVLAAQRFDNVRNMAPGSSEALDPFSFGLKTFA